MSRHELGPVVVAVLSHRDAPLLRRLTDRILEGRRSVVLIHHDPRGEPHGLHPGERIMLVDDPQPCDWGGISFARAMVQCVEVALDRVPNLSWVLLVSGQDYPARCMTEVERDLAGLNADAVLRWYPVDPRPDQDIHPWQARCRRRYLHRRVLPFGRRALPMPRRHPFGRGTDLYVADTWVNLGHRAARRLVEVRPRMSEVERYLDTVPNPDEALLPTLLLNHADDLQLIHDRRRYVRWTPGDPHPAYLSSDDLPAIRASSAYFCRKVDSERNRDVVDLLDAAAAADR